MIVPLVDLLEIGIAVGAVAGPVAYDVYKKKDVIKDALEYQKKMKEKKVKEEAKKKN